MRLSKDDSSRKASGIKRRDFRADPSAAPTEDRHRKNSRRRGSRDCEHEWSYQFERYGRVRLRCKRCSLLRWLSGEELVAWKEEDKRTALYGKHRFELRSEYGRDRVYYPYGVIECADCGLRLFLSERELERWKQR